MIKHRLAHTLLELLVASAVLMLLGTALVLILRSGSQSWLHAAQRADRLGELQRVLRDLGSELEAAPQASLGREAGPPASLSFASGWSLRGDKQFAVQADGRPRWQKFVIYYLANGEFCRREVAIPPTHAQALLARPLAETDLPPLQPQASWCRDGKSLSPMVAHFECTQPQPQIIEVRLETTPDPRYPQARPPSLSTTFWLHQ